jgi:hypothetical protein
VHLDAPLALRAFLRTLKNKAIEVTVRKQVKHRTKPQVAYYFSVVIPEFAAGVGYRRDEHYELHDALMHRFWPLDPDRLTGSPRRRRLTLKDQGAGDPLSDEEMGIHIEQVVILAAEQGVIIQDADKDYKRKRLQAAA